MEDDQFVMTLVGVRMQGARRILGNSEKSADWFDGLLPVAEDWHAKVCLLEVRVYLYNGTTPKGHYWDLRRGYSDHTNSSFYGTGNIDSS